MILASYVGTRDEATADDIHVCDRTIMYFTDNKIFFCELSHIFSGRDLWVHSKCVVKTRNRQLAYKRNQNHLFGRNALGNRDAVCETTIGRLEYQSEKKSFNWEKYTNLHVDQHNIKATLYSHGFNDWSEAQKV